MPQPRRLPPAALIHWRENISQPGFVPCFRPTRPIKGFLSAFTSRFRRSNGCRSREHISAQKAMPFEIGIPIPKPLEEQLVATLREHNPALRQSSGEEIVRQVELAEVLGALGTLRRIPVLHQIANLVDPDLLEGFDRDSLRKEKTVPLRLSDEYLTVAIANPYGNYKLIYERRHQNRQLVPVLTSAAQINGVLSGSARIQQITADEIRRLEGDDASGEVRDFDLNKPAEDSVVRNLQSIIQEGITRRASDIHLLTEKDRFHFTLRLE